MPVTRRSTTAVLLLLAAACGGRPREAPVAEPHAVRLAPVTEVPVSRPIEVSGTLGARDEIPLSFKVGGVVARVLVDAGDRVRAGQVLATLEPREVDAGVAKAKAALDKAERDFERASRLYADSVVTRAQYEDARTALDIARADHEAATFNRRYAVVTAPFAGTVLQRSAEPGALVTPGQPVVRLASGARGAVVRAGLADRDVVRVRRGDPARVTFDALPGRTFAGRVTEIAAAATPGPGTYAVAIALDGAETLPTGLVARVTIAPSAAGTLPSIPVEALVEADSAEGIVFVLTADRTRAVRRSVQVAFIADGRVALRGGLDGAALVVTDGAAFLDDGDAVRVTP